MDIKILLQEMLNKGASDMHIRSNGPVVLRIDGRLMPIAFEGSVHSSDEVNNLALSIMNEEQKTVFKHRHEIDISYSFEGYGRFRMNIFRQRGLVNMALRFVPTKIPTIQEMNLPPAINQIAENQRGLVLVTGTTGCGKSTTLAAIIDQINSSRAVHIVTIEDPIEFIHKDKKSIISQRELEFDTLSYVDALRNVVRQDTNVILLGEIRDLDTMSTAMTAAQTGHLVLSTIHTVDAHQSIFRIIDMFPPHQQNQMRIMLADTLKAVISQRLLPYASGKGRIPVVEVLIVTPLVKKLIEENNLSEIINVMKQGEYYGMQTFNQALIKLFKKGDIKLEDALYAATNPEELMLTVRGIQTGNQDASDIFER